MRLDANLDELSEARGIDIPTSLRVAERLKNRIGVKNVGFDSIAATPTGTLLARLHLLRLTWNVQLLLWLTVKYSLASPSDIRKNDLTCLGFAGSRFACDDYRLILLVDDQLLERVFSDHE